MLTVKGFSETVFFREWSNQVFDSLEFPKKSTSGDHLLFSKCLKFDVESRTGTKKLGKVFPFKDNCI